MTQLRIEPLRAKDLAVYTLAHGGAAPHWVEPVGYAAMRGDEVVGVGCLFALGDRWWGLVDAPCLHGRGMILHRLAVGLLARAKATGVPVFVLRNDDLPTSSRWLKRLGFRPTGETMNEREVWICPA